MTEVTIMKNCSNKICTNHLKYKARRSLTALSGTVAAAGGHCFSLRVTVWKRDYVHTTNYAHILPFIPALCSLRKATYYAGNYDRIIASSLPLLDRFPWDKDRTEGPGKLF